MKLEWVRSQARGQYGIAGRIDAKSGWSVSLGLERRPTLDLLPCTSALRQITVQNCRFWLLLNRVPQFRGCPETAPAREPFT